MKFPILILTLLTVNIISIDECDKGEYSTQCKNCNGKECQDCNTMDFLKNGKCLNCDRHMIGCYECDNETVCKRCEEFYVKKDGKCIRVQSLIPGCETIHQFDFTLCQKCYPGMYPNVNYTKCLKCLPNCY